jgi:hypothetical protein
MTRPDVGGKGVAKNKLEGIPMTVGYLGLACIVAAIMGGGSTLFGLKFPPITSPKRQVLLALFGGVLCALGFVKHEVARCTDWRATTWSNNNPDLFYNVPDPSTDRIVSAHVETVLDRKGGGYISPSISKRSATEITGKCSAVEDATSNGKCRIHANVNTALVHWGNCQ